MQSIYHLPIKLSGYTKEPGKSEGVVGGILSEGYVLMCVGNW